MLCSNSGIEKTFLFESLSKLYISTDSSPVDMHSYELCSDTIDVVYDMALLYSSPKNGIEHEISEDDSSCAVVKLNNGMVVYARKVNDDLTLVSLLRGEFWEKGLVEYNCSCVCESIIEVLERDRVAS